MEESLGKYLQRMRTEKGYSLSDISAMTCIGLEYLTAVEAEDFPKLPATQSQNPMLEPMPGAFASMNLTS